MNSGVIVVGYPGIGKTTLSQTSDHFLDLESSCFRVDNEHIEDWEIVYCQVAVHLAKQGYVVFCSSHKIIRDRLWTMDLPDCVHKMCVVPSEDLKDKWIEKLKLRHERSRYLKDFYAYVRASERYIEDIKSIKNDFDVILELKSLEYDLEGLLKEKFADNFGLYLD